MFWGQLRVFSLIVGPLFDGERKNKSVKVEQLEFQVCFLYDIYMCVHTCVVSVVRRFVNTPGLRLVSCSSSTW